MDPNTVFVLLHNHAKEQFYKGECEKASLVLKELFKWKRSLQGSAEEAEFLAIPDQLAEGTRTHEEAFGMMLGILTYLV